MFSVWVFFFLGVCGFWDEMHSYAYLYLLGYLEIFHYLNCHFFSINFMADLVAVFNSMHCLPKKVETFDLVLDHLTSHLRILCHHLWKGNTRITLCCANLLAFFVFFEFNSSRTLSGVLCKQFIFIFITICEVYWNLQVVLFLAEEITLPNCVLTCMQSSAWLKKT